MRLPVYILSVVDANQKAYGTAKNVMLMLIQSVLMYYDHCNNCKLTVIGQAQQAGAAIDDEDNDDDFSIMIGMSSRSKRSKS